MISGPFISRPRLAGAISIVIALAGAIAALFLPIEQYPDLSPPSVNVAATYPGADAQVIADTVGAPIEAARMPRPRAMPFVVILRLAASA